MQRFILTSDYNEDTKCLRIENYTWNPAGDIVILHSISSIFDYSQPIGWTWHYTCTGCYDGFISLRQSKKKDR